MTPAEESPLTFHWPDRKEISLALPLFLIVSLLAHAATFYLFQIVYPPSATSPNPPVEASFWQKTSVDSPIGLWLAAEDPTLMTWPQAATPPQSFDLSYQPFYNTVRAEPQQVSNGNRYVPFPRGLSLHEEMQARQPTAADSLPQKPLHTQITFSAEISNLAPGNFPDLPFKRLSVETLQPAIFFIGISETGDILYSFVEVSSGNPSADEVAEAYLSTLRCKPSGGHPRWGFVTFHWGVDSMKSTSKEQPPHLPEQ
ncbi:MAG: hypothetical protein QM796_11480 [Chthoniobacteraceae bacterium]